MLSQFDRKACARASNCLEESLNRHSKYTSKDGYCELAPPPRSQRFIMDLLYSRPSAQWLSRLLRAVRRSPNRPRRARSCVTRRVSDVVSISYICLHAICTQFSGNSALGSHPATDLRPPKRALAFQIDSTLVVFPSTAPAVFVRLFIANNEVWDSTTTERRPDNWHLRQQHLLSVSHPHRPIANQNLHLFVRSVASPPSSIATRPYPTMWGWSPR